MLKSSISSNSVKHMSFLCTQFKCQTVLFDPMDRTLLRATTPVQSRPWSDNYKGVLHIPQSSSLTEASPLDWLMAYLGRVS